MDRKEKLRREVETKAVESRPVTGLGQLTSLQAYRCPKQVLEFQYKYYYIQLHLKFQEPWNLRVTSSGKVAET